MTLGHDYTMLLKSFDIQEDPLEMKEWKLEQVAIGEHRKYIFLYIREKGIYHRVHWPV